MNIQDLLDHIYEVKDTLSNGLVGQRANDYANNFNNNLQTNFPALKANPTIDDIVNTGLNIGGIGSIRTPKDMFSHIGNPSMDDGTFFTKYQPNLQGIPLSGSLEPSFDKVKDSLAKYYSKHYATEHDPIVKAVDKGLRFPEDAGDYVDYNLTNPFINSKKIQKLFDEFGLGKFDHAMGDRQFGVDLIPMLERGDPESLIDAESIQSAVDKLRGVRGTSQIATTPIGKYFENLNDLTALTNSTGNAKSLFTTKDKISDDLWLDEQVGKSYVNNNFVRPYNAEVNKILKSDYYKKTEGTDRRVFTTPQVFNDSINTTLGHMADILPNNRTLSLQDAIGYAIKHDADAAKRAEMAKNKDWLAEQFNSGDILSKYNDGHHWKKITDPNVLSAEGECLAHCVGTYEGKVKGGKSEIYSLRTPDGNPLYTVELDPKTNKIVQIRGKANSSVKPEHGMYIEPFKNAAKVYSNSPDYFKQQGINSFEDLLKNMDLNQ
jgi:hypothetical protein